MLKKIKLGTAGALSVVLLAAAPVAADQPSNPGSSNPHNKVTICHATKSKNNPYVRITVNANGSVSGHAGNSHQNGRDIIPPFDYNDNGSTKSFLGQNWNSQGQAIYNNGCRAGGQGGGGGGGTTSGGQVSGRAASAGVAAATSTVPTAGAQVMPQGGVAAGDGGAKVTSVASVAGLLGSVATLGAGLALYRRA